MTETTDRETNRELQRRERIEVERDGEELVVFNCVNIKQPAVVRGSNPVVEKFEAEIGAGDSPMKPDAVTHWVAEELDVEFGIDPTDQGIEVVDVTSDEVGVYL
jgi:hypothetical protein